MALLLLINNCEAVASIDEWYDGYTDPHVQIEWSEHPQVGVEKTDTLDGVITNIWNDVFWYTNLFWYVLYCYFVSEYRF